MAMFKTALDLLLLLSLVQTLHAAVYKVGDSAGWTNTSDVHYKLWSAAKTFELGDVVVFEYNPQFHNVMRVTHAMYKACDASAPMETYTSGNDSITMNTNGHHYFICGVPGHCQAGQRLDINVFRSLERVPAPEAAEAPSASFGHSVNSPAPSPNSAVSLNSLKNPSEILGFGLAMAASAMLLLSHM